MLQLATIEEHLRQAREHVERGENCLARQRAVVAELERDGHDTTEARRLLSEFESLQSLHIADRDRLAREVAKCRQEEKDETSPE